MDKEAKAVLVRKIIGCNVYVYVVWQRGQGMEGSRETLLRCGFSGLVHWGYDFIF